jgi:hypothetical protein
MVTAHRGGEELLTQRLELDVGLLAADGVEPDP